MSPCRFVTFKKKNEKNSYPSAINLERTSEFQGQQSNMIPPKYCSPIPSTIPPPIFPPQSLKYEQPTECTKNSMLE